MNTSLKVRRHPNNLNSLRVILKNLEEDWDCFSELTFMIGGKPKGKQPPKEPKEPKVTKEGKDDKEEDGTKFAGIILLIYFALDEKKRAIKTAYKQLKVPKVHIFLLGVIYCCMR